MVRIFRVSDFHCITSSTKIFSHRTFPKLWYSFPFTKCCGFVNLDEMSDLTLCAAIHTLKAMQLRYMAYIRNYNHEIFVVQCYLPD